MVGFTKLKFLAFALIIGGAFGPPLSAQVRIEGLMIQTAVIKPGGETVFHITVRNENPEAILIKVFLRDYATVPDGDQFLPSGSTERSLLPWLTTPPAESFSLEAKSRGTIELPVKVPSDAPPGSRNLLVLVEPEIKQEPLMATNKRGISIVTQYGIQLIVTVPGGSAVLKVTAHKSNGQEFLVDVVNTGSAAGEWWVKTDLAKEERTLRLYPGCSKRLKWSLDELPEGVTSVRVLFDDRKRDIVPFFFDVERRRPEPVPIPLTAEALEARRRASRPHLSLNLSLLAGNLQKTGYINGSFRWGRTTLSASSQAYMWGNQITQGQTVSASWRPTNWLSFNASKAWWTGYGYSSIGTYVNLKSTSFYVNYMPEFSYLTGGLRQRIFNRVDVVFNCYANSKTGRREWTAGLDIPIVR